MYKRNCLRSAFILFFVSCLGSKVRADVLHSYDARGLGHTDSLLRDGTAARHWSMSGCVLDKEVESQSTQITAAYHLVNGGTGVGGDTTPFAAGNTSFELWIRPGSLNSNHQVIFETGGGQNGSSILITDVTIRFLNSRTNIRNFDLTVPLGGIDTSDFLHIVASLDEQNGHIDLHVRGAAGDAVRVDGNGPVGRGGNRASLFSWGSGTGSLGGGHNNLGGRTELAGASPLGLTQFLGEIALLRVHDRALNDAEIEAAFDEVAGAVPEIEAFSVDPSNIAGGERATLSWRVNNATDISIDPEPGEVTNLTEGGVGQVEVAPEVTTTYVLTVSDGQHTRSAAVQVTVDGLMFPPSITEFMADNDDTLTDGDGRSSDWIEIHNPNQFPINLEGHYLSDSKADLQLWQFPSLEIGPDAYQIIFASNREPSGEQGIFDALGFPYADLRLSSSGEFLALVAPDGSTILSEFAPSYPQQFEDVSFGLSRGEAGYFTDPTPGEPNGERVLGFVDDTAFSVDRGLFEEPFTVEISTSTPEASIRYTLDGSAPIPDAPGKEGSGMLYTGPIEITTTTTLRAVAYLEDHAPSNVDTQTYIFLRDVVEQPSRLPGFPSTWAGRPADYEMDPEVIGPDNLFDDVYRDTIIDDLQSLPIMSVVMDRTDLFGPTGLYDNSQGEGVAWERPASVEFFFPKDTRRGFQQNCAIRIQGGSSRSPNYPKHSFRLLFKRDYGPGKLRYPLFADQPQGANATDTFDTIILRAHFNNSWTHWHWFQNPRALYVRDQWMRDSQLAMGSPSPHGMQVHLYLNGLYWGIYNPSERPTAPFMAEYYGGDREDFDTQNVNGARDGDLTAWNTMMSLANGGLATLQAYNNIREYLDVVNLADYMMLNFYAGNDDWDGHNWYAGRRREEGAGYQFFCWDSELIISRHAFPPPQPDFNVILNRDRVGLNNNNKPSRLFTQLRSNPEFRLLFADRVQRHFNNGGALTTENSIERWMERVDQIWNAVVAESARWGDYRRDVLQHADYTSDQYDLFHRDEHYASQLDWIINTYFPQRRDIVLAQFRSRGLLSTVEAPTLAPHGGEIASDGSQVTLSAPSGDIYFTLDGEDPRLEGGALSGSATLYSQPLELTETTLVMARVRDGQTWSAITEALFTKDTGLRVTEIQYHPASPSNGSTFDAEEFAYIELQNTSAVPIDLRGIGFVEGIRFEFSDGAVNILQPDEVLVVLENFEAFVERYDREDVLIVGEYSGELSNDGETLHLVGRYGETIQKFTYNDIWYRETDGTGPSLVIKDSKGPLESWDLAESWRPSSSSSGTPGVEEPSLGEGGLQLSGDITQDSVLDLSDPIVLLTHLFTGKPESLPCGDGSTVDTANVSLLDVNGDLGLDMSDSIHLLAYLFLGGSPPAGGLECQRRVRCPDACLQ